MEVLQTPALGIVFKPGMHILQIPANMDLLFVQATIYTGRQELPLLQQPTESTTLLVVRLPRVPFLVIMRQYFYVFTYPTVHL